MQITQEKKTTLRVRPSELVSRLIELGLEVPGGGLAVLRVYGEDGEETEITLPSLIDLVWVE